MNALITLIDIVSTLFIYLLVANAILSWLIAFNVINTSNQFVSSVGMFLHKVTEPLLVRIRRFIPNLGGIDISPVILIILIIVIRSLLVDDLLPRFR